MNLFPMQSTASLTFDGCASGHPETGHCTANIEPFSHALTAVFVVILVMGIMSTALNQYVVRDIANHVQSWLTNSAGLASTANVSSASNAAPRFAKIAVIDR